MPQAGPLRALMHVSTMVTISRLKENDFDDVIMIMVTVMITIYIILNGFTVRISIVITKV